MATVTLPAGWCPAAFAMRAVNPAFLSRSQATGQQQVRGVPGWYWQASVEWPMRQSGGAMDAFIGRLGPGDLLQMAHPVRPVPVGTLRGSPQVNGAHNAGAKTLAIKNATNGQTLLAGDFVGVGGVVYMVASDVTVSGGGASVALTTGLRAALTNNTAVAWNAPTINWRVMPGAMLVYRPGYQERVAMDLEEAVT